MHGVEPEGVGVADYRRRFRPQPGRLHDDVLQGRLADSPYGQADTNEGYGWLGSLMALDIAVIQDKYGVNEDWATGNDTYPEGRE